MDPGHFFSSRALEEEFIKTKTELTEIEKNLKTVFNLSPIYEDFNAKRKHDLSPKYVPKFDPRKRAKVSASNKFEKSPDILKEISDESEDSPDESEDSLEVSIHSVVKNADIQSRKDIIRGQNVNLKVESRNRRILGMLQGTLLKFKNEAEKRKFQDLKRVQIEQKVEAAAIEEREKQKELRKDLLLKRKQKQSHLNCLEEKINITELFESWENNQNNLLNFIITETGPPICFLPSSHTSNSKRQHEKSKMKIWDAIQKHKIQLNEELAEIKESRLKKSIHPNKYTESHRDYRADTEEMAFSDLTGHSDFLEERQNGISSNLQLQKDDKSNFV